MGKCTRSEHQLFLHLKTRRLNVVSPPAVKSSTSDRVLAAKINSNSVDLKEDEELDAITAADLSDRRETASSGEVESVAIRKQKSKTSCRRSTVTKMPSEDELEEFFSVAEKKLQKQFTEKYNFDVVKDEPLEGRYEWVRIEN